MGMAQSTFGMNKFGEAVVPIEEMFQKNPNSAYTIDASLLASRAYAEVGRADKDATKQAEYYGKSIKAMNAVRKLSKDPEMLAKADLELANIQLMMGKKEEAAASYERLILFGDLKNPRIRACIEKAFELSYNVLLGLGRYEDILENCTLYLKNFPDGGLVSQARKWRDEAMARSKGGATPPPAKSGEGSGAPPAN